MGIVAWTQEGAAQGRRVCASSGTLKYRGGRHHVAGLVWVEAEDGTAEQRRWLMLDHACVRPQNTLDVLVLLFASSEGDVPPLSSRNPPDWWCQSLA